MESLRIIFRRVAFFFLAFVPLSVLAKGLNYLGIFGTRSEAVFILMAGEVLFFIINFLAFRMDYKVIINKGMYFLFNLLAILVFFIIMLILYIALPASIFVWPFSLTRFLCYFENLEIANITSFMAFHGVLIASVILAPIGAKDDVIM